MATSFERLKSISLVTQYLINGYIRRCEKDLFAELVKQNPYYHIPQLIINYCILFYETFAWYKKNYGEGLEFISDTEVKVIKPGDKWTTCFLENEVSNQICEIFSMTFKVISFGDEINRPDFCVGYTTENGSIEESGIKWDEPLWGHSCNKLCTQSWGMYGWGLYHSTTAEVFKPVKTSVSHSKGDIWKISFDFKEEQVKLYQFDKEMDCKDFNQTKLFIGFSFYYSGSYIKIIEYKYD